MSALLRQPASVPALFSRNAEPDRWIDAGSARHRPGPSRWAKIASGSSGLAQGTAVVAGSIVALLAEAPLVKAATLLITVSLPQ